MTICYGGGKQGNNSKQNWKSSLGKEPHDGTIGNDAGARAFIWFRISEWFQKHTGLEALPSKKKVSVDGTGVPGFLTPVW